MIDADPIRTDALAKHYGARVAVAGLDLRVGAGDVYGFLGPNGAGKTTTLRMLLGLIRPTSGRALLFGRDPRVAGVRALDGVAGFVEAPRFYPYLTGRRNLSLLADLDGDGARARIPGALDVVDLTDRAEDRVGGYSQGMRQRLGIAAALIRAPRLLLLDEPTNGLDPPGMRDVRELVRRLAGEGITVVLSSHLMAEVEAVCGRVGILRRGSVVYEGSIADLRRAADASLRLRSTHPARALLVCANRPGITGVERRGDDVVLRAADDAALAACTMALADAGIGVLGLVAEGPNLEELFLRLTEDGDAAGATDMEAVA